MGGEKEYIVPSALPVPDEPSIPVFSNSEEEEGSLVDLMMTAVDESVVLRLSPGTETVQFNGDISQRPPA
jgi:hypothetical protein